MLKMLSLITSATQEESSTTTLVSAKFDDQLWTNIRNFFNQSKNVTTMERQSNGKHNIFGKKITIIGRQFSRQEKVQTMFQY